MALNTLEKLLLDRQVARLTGAVRRIERMLQGQPIDTVRIADLAVTSAKIASLAVSKLTVGVFSEIMDVGTPASGSVKIDGENNRIVVEDATDPRIVIGEV